MAKVAIAVFPGSNCERDVQTVLDKVYKFQPELVWHKKSNLRNYDAIIIPGGFSYGDRLRAGVIAAHSPIIKEVKRKAKDGIPILGICNGFQILIESCLLPGALVKNKHLRFVCKWVDATVTNVRTPFTLLFRRNQKIRIPIAHGEGRYVADSVTIKELRQKNQIVLSFLNENPNGSIESIAAVCNPEGNVVGMMPHPERASERILSPVGGSVDGSTIFRSLVHYLGESYPA